MRWLSLLLCALPLGCAQPADSWLEGIDPADASALATPDAGPDAAPPVGPQAQLEETRPLDVPSEPRGLAWDGDYLWTTDRADDRLLRLDLDGTINSSWPLPERGARALTWHAGALYVGYAASIYRFENNIYEPLAETRELTGIATGVDGLISAQSDGLFVRHDENLAPRLELSYAASPGPLVRFGDDYLIYSHSPRLDGDRFTPQLIVADATGANRAEIRGAIELPLDTGRVTGMTLDGDRLWLIGAGYGSESYQLTAWTLTPEIGR
jgi:hypothetical protein